MSSSPVLLTDRDAFHVYLDTTPGVHATATDEIGWYLPVLGPTAVVVARLLASRTPQLGRVWELADLSERVGLGGGLSRLRATLSRLEQFRVLKFHDLDLATVRVFLPELSDRQLARLSPAGARRYLAHSGVAAVSER